MDSIQEDTEWKRGSSPWDERKMYNPLEAVQIEAQVILRILNHVRLIPPTHHAQGQLLGLDVEDTLHITSSFAYKKKDENEQSEDQEEFAAYQMDMLEALREVNMDSNTVGWYSVTLNGNLFPENFLDIQLATQRSVPKSVAIICDPNEAGAGFPAFKAYRLDLPRNTLMNSQLDSVAIQLSANHLQEVPITVRASPLVELFFNRHVGPQVNKSYDAMHTDLGPYMDSSLRHLFEGLQKLQSEQSQIYQHERHIRQQQKGRGFQSFPPPRQQGPVPTDTLLTSKQIASHCKHIQRVAESSLSKLYLVSRDQKN